jgi:hypothetical protein
MIRFDTVKTKSPEEFLRDVGLQLNKFLDVLNNVIVCIEKEKQDDSLKRRGIRSDYLTIADKLLLTFYYLRHYPTFAKLGQMFGISESYANKIYHKFLDILTKVLKMPNPRALLEPKAEPIGIDVTEQPIERPKKGQKAYYSGKKKQHTIKIQLIVCLVTLCILSVCCRKGKVHDFRILKEDRPAIHSETKKLGDLGYIGIDKLYKNTQTPVKKSKKKPLTEDDKSYNRKLAKVRIGVEHVNRRCKIFKIVKDKYRGKHKNYSKVWNVIAALVNLRYAS